MKANHNISKNTDIGATPEKAVSAEEAAQAQIEDADAYEVQDE